MDGYTECEGDCDDTNPAINPAATEICNGLDDDCNGNPEATATTWTGNGDALNWSDPANWSDGIVPLPCQDVVIPAGSDVFVPAGFTAEGKTLQVDNTAQLTVPVTAIMEMKNP